MTGLLQHKIYCYMSDIVLLGWFSITWILTVQPILNEQIICKYTDRMLITQKLLTIMLMGCKLNAHQCLILKSLDANLKLTKC